MRVLRTSIVSRDCSKTRHRLGRIILITVTWKKMTNSCAPRFLCLIFIFVSSIVSILLRPQLTQVFGRLLYEKRLRQEELRGLREDKLKLIRSFAKFLAETRPDLHSERYRLVT